MKMMWYCKKMSLTLAIVTLAFLCTVQGDDSQDVCKIFDANGCSVPLGLPFFYKRQFTPSCDFHDICYSCGKRFGLSRLACDRHFREHMRATCKDGYSQPEQRTKREATEGKHSHSDRVLAAREWNSQRFISLIRSQVFPKMKDIFNTGDSSNLVNFPPYDLHRHVVGQMVYILANSTKGDEPSDLELPPYNDDGSEEIPDLSMSSNAIPSASLETQGALEPENGNELEPMSREKAVIKDLCEFMLKRAQSDSSRFSHLTCPDVNLMDCDFFAEVYFVAVRVFGGPHYLHVPASFCKKPSVNRCIKS